MSIRVNRRDFEGKIILGRGYCNKIYNFIHYDLNNRSDNFYNDGVYGWNFSIEEMNISFGDLKQLVYIVNGYRNIPYRAGWVDYDRIDNYFNRIIKNFNKKTDNYCDLYKLRKTYIKRITKKLNKFLSEDWEKMQEAKYGKR